MWFYIFLKQCVVPYPWATDPYAFLPVAILLWSIAVLKKKGKKKKLQNVQILNYVIFSNNFLFEKFEYFPAELHHLKYQLSCFA